jgi:class 3 adenylate cyclase
MENAREVPISSSDRLHKGLRELFQQAEARDVYHARPSQLAARLEAEPRPTLEALVQAMFGGDAILHWELECPMCRAFGEINNPLIVPVHEHTCKACGAHFEVAADAETQVTFSPHPNLRDLDEEAADREHLQHVHSLYPPTTVHELMTVQAFRQWARDEPLPVGQYLEVRKMALWFSDLTGSTALYARNGDPFAYGLVSEHFTLVSDAVQGAGGALVKTIGDGVMAVFTTARRGLQAALDANRRLADFNDANALAGDRRLRLKVGVHVGPAIAVTLNERLDYFGTTVNVASRVSNLARGREIVLTNPAYRAPDVAELAAAHPVDAFETPIRGLDEPITVHRLRLDDADQSEPPPSPFPRWLTRLLGHREA